MHQLVERNVIVIQVKKSPESRDRIFDSEICGQLCAILSVTPPTDTQGFQSRLDRGDVIVELWLKNHIQAEKFSSDEVREICPGFSMVSVHPAISKEVPMVIIGLPFNLPE